MDHDLRHWAAIARRWWWLLIVLPLLAAVVANLVTDRNDSDSLPTYETFATLLVSPIQTSGRLQYSSATYGEMLRTKPVLEPVVRQLDLPFGVQTLKLMISSRPVQDDRGRPTEIIRVSVFDSDPERAAAIANAVAKSFVAFIDSQADELTGTTQAQLDLVIATANSEIAAKEAEITALESAANVEDVSVQEKIATLRSEINEMRESLSQHLATKLTMSIQAATLQSQVTLVNQAGVPAEPVPQPKGLEPTLPAALAGLMLAGAIVGLLGALDRVIGTAPVAARVADAPILSTVPREKHIRAGVGQLFALHEPHSATSESIRRLRTNLEFAGSAFGKRIIAIGSSQRGDGKSTITANLAVTMAQAGLRVVVIDADLRRPSQHAIFGIDNSRGLSILLTQRNQSWQAFETPIRDVPGLSVIPSGPVPPNPAELLSLHQFRTTLDDIARSADYVLIDTSPILIVADSLVVGSRADGIVLVCRADKTKREELRAAVEALRQGNVEVLGLVANQNAETAPIYSLDMPNVRTRSSRTIAEIQNRQLPAEADPANRSVQHASDAIGRDTAHHVRSLTRVGDGNLPNGYPTEHVLGHVDGSGNRDEIAQ